MMAIAILFTSNLSWAGPEISNLSIEPPTSRAEFCQESRSKDYFMKLAQNRENRLNFSNSGGLFDGGVCWWHSRFQRAALYLSVFKPNKKKPTQEQAKKIIKKIARRNGVVEIPGYSNLNAFAQDWEKLIQKKLDNWQLTDGFLMQQWVVGLLGKTETEASKMKKKMDALYIEVHHRKNITYQKLQLKGIDAHAWLVVGMDKTHSGYRLHVIDSNYPKAVAHTDYEIGDTGIADVIVITPRGQIMTFNYGGFVAYSERKNELKRLKKAVNVYCGRKTTLKNKLEKGFKKTVESIKKKTKKAKEARKAKKAEKTVKKIDTFKEKVREKIDTLKENAQEKIDALKEKAEQAAIVNASITPDEFEIDFGI